jgi:predicted DNA-binding transcriptional regulator YafY
MSASRLLSIQFMLQARGRMPARALAEALEVSERTIYRDIDALSAAGVPIYADPGRNGGVALLDGHRTRLTGLTAAESAGLPFAALSHAARALGMGPEAASAHLKILASLPADAAARAAWIEARFHLDPTPWGHVPEVLPLLPAIAQAVWRGQRLRVRYDGWSRRVIRTLTPLGLVQKASLWYLVAVARTSPRVYRVANIVEASVLEAVGERPTRFDLAGFWSAWAQEFETGLQRSVCIIRISPEGRRILRAVQPRADVLIEQSAVPDEKKGWVRASFPVETPAYTARQLLRLGAGVEVISPTSMRRAIAREARRVSALYGKAPR